MFTDSKYPLIEVLTNYKRENKFSGKTLILSKCKKRARPTVGQTNVMSFPHSHCRLKSCICVKFPDFERMVYENVFVLRNYAWRYLRVKGHHSCNLLLN